MITKPILASALEKIEEAKLPALATPKFDGIRCLIINGKAVSRKLKPIPNKYIREKLEQDLAGLELDGELLIPNKPFNEVSSAVMSFDGEPEFEFWVFDYINDDLKTPYHVRMTELGALSLPSYCKKVLPRVVNTHEELVSIEQLWTTQGYEGVMIRSMNAPYKCGRSTVREGYLLKIKRFEDSEAVVLGFDEKLHNANEATIDELGHTKRSSHQANMIPCGTLGAFLVRDIHTGVEFRVATGMDDATRDMIWKDKDKYLNKLVKYKHQPAGAKVVEGQASVPRFPVFLGFRSEDDM